ncbi:unnamed protein product [Allacma fusca]|uniref:Uncharacterized protein n=1 Tax=Allacma fusca TaxID=39272 RepID=A0A8J2KB38_9HEXA|nr:unnamed protein product [Allacma fusca]
MQNLDAVFCGISEVDTKLLQSKSAIELKDLELTMEMPCIISMPNLRKLRIEMKPHKACQGKSDVSPVIFASRVTGLLAFTRLPNLRVEVLKRMCGIQCWYHLKHLESFVRFINE